MILLHTKLAFQITSYRIQFKGNYNIRCRWKIYFKWIQQLPELTQVSVKSKTITLNKGKKQISKKKVELQEWI